MLEPEIDYELIKAYAEGLLDDAGAVKARSIIQQSRKAYEVYVSLKEAMFLSRTGWDVSEKEVQGVFETLKQTRSDIFVRFSGDRIMVSQSSMDEPGYSGIHSSFSGGMSQTGPVTITRSLEGNEISITLKPIPETDQIILSISGFTGSARLLHKGVILDEIDDLSAVGTFKNKLASRGRYEIVLRGLEQRQFSIGLVLESD